MKHLKSFEQHSAGPVNEEIFGTAKKFFTGHESGEDKEAAKGACTKQLEDLLAKYPDLAGNKDKYLERATEDNYRGTFSVTKARSTGKTIIVYTPKATGMQKLASAAGNSLTA
jgi:hypothetical protein